MRSRQRTRSRATGRKACAARCARMGSRRPGGFRWKIWHRRRLHRRTAPRVRRPRSAPNLPARKSRSRPPPKWLRRTSVRTSRLRRSMPPWPCSSKRRPSRRRRLGASQSPAPLRKVTRVPLGPSPVGTSLPMTGPPRPQPRRKSRRRLPMRGLGLRRSRCRSGRRNRLPPIGRKRENQRRRRCRKPRVPTGHRCAPGRTGPPPAAPNNRRSKPGERRRRSNSPSGLPRPRWNRNGRRPRPRPRLNGPLPPPQRWPKNGTCRSRRRRRRQRPGQSNPLLPLPSLRGTSPPWARARLSSSTPNRPRRNRARPRNCSAAFRTEPHWAPLTTIWARPKCWRRPRRYCDRWLSITTIRTFPRRRANRPERARNRSRHSGRPQ